MRKSTYEISANLMRGMFKAFVGTPPVLDLERYFPHHFTLLNHFQAMKREAEQILARLHSVPRFHDIDQTHSPHESDIDADWRFLFLKCYGVDVARNMLLAPETAGLISARPEILTAGFSFMAPGKGLPLHRGPFKGVLRYHLCLKVEPDAQGECHLVLDGQKFDYIEGDGLIWDDTYWRAVVNRSRSHRIVLILDILRPDLPVVLRLISAFVVFVVSIAVRKKISRFAVDPKALCQGVAQH
jgi:aspartate beta-hydroxylase